MASSSDRMFTRRALGRLGLAAVAAPAVLTSARAQQKFTCRIAHTEGIGTPITLGFEKWTGILKERSGGRIDAQHFPAAQLGGLVDLIGEGVISGRIAKDLFEILWSEGGDPREIVQARGMKQVTDTGAIEKAVDELIAANPDKVEQVQAKPTMLGWFVGQAMKASGGKANPQAVQALVKAKLGIDYESIRQINPKIVYGSISGFGQDGPYHKRPGFDQIAQGMGGLMSVTGAPLCRVMPFSAYQSSGFITISAGSWLPLRTLDSRMRL